MAGVSGVDSPGMTGVGGVALGCEKLTWLAPKVPRGPQNGWVEGVTGDGDLLLWCLAGVRTSSPSDRSISSSTYLPFSYSRVVSVHLASDRRDQWNA